MLEGYHVPCDAGVSPPCVELDRGLTSLLACPAWGSRAGDGVCCLDLILPLGCCYQAQHSCLSVHFPFVLAWSGYG